MDQAPSMASGAEIEGVSLGERETARLEAINCRAEFTLNQHEFAKCLGVAPLTVERWEAGTLLPRPFYRKVLTLCLEVPEALSWLRRSRNASPK